MILHEEELWPSCRPINPSARGKSLLSRSIIETSSAQPLQALGMGSLISQAQGIGDTQRRHQVFEAELKCLHKAFLLPPIELSR